MKKYLLLFIFILLTSSCNQEDITSVDVVSPTPATTSATAQQPVLITEQTKQGVYFTRTGKRIDNDNTGLFGELSLVDNCLRLKHGESEESTLLIWQHDVELSEQDDQIEVVGVYGVPSIHVGDSLALMGTGKYYQLPDEWQALIPDECNGPYFIVGLAAPYKSEYE